MSIQRKICLLLKIIKLNKQFLKFFPVLYLNRKNIFFNQVNNVKFLTLEIYYVDKGIVLIKSITFFL